MEELKAMINAEFCEELEKEGEPITFSPEEREKWRKTYSEFSENGSKNEKRVRSERVKAAAKPDVYLTF